MIVVDEQRRQTAIAIAFHQLQFGGQQTAQVALNRAEFRVHHNRTRGVDGELCKTNNLIDNYNHNAP